jgi:protoporphyrinogen oxidase
VTKTTAKAPGQSEAISSKHDYAVSTIFAGKLAKLFGDKSSPIMPPMHATTVATVNVYYRNSHVRPSWIHGFGYLIPQAVPLAQNPERGLGVVFDSDATPEAAGQQGTKMTVMIGGHYWDGWSELPSEEDCKDMALSLLERHLGIKEPPQAIHAKINHECIPQYTVGHQERMRRAHFGLMQNFEGRLSVAGSSYHGVSVNDCVNSGRLAHKRLGTTGLEVFEDGNQMLEISKEDHPFTLRVVEVETEEQ